MRYTPQEPEPVFEALEPVVRGLGLSIVELSVSRQKKSVRIRLVVYKPGVLGVDDCSRVHHAILPRLELTFPGGDLYVEVSSPGIDRLMKDGAEFVHYIGRGVRCYRTDISDWTGGILQSADAGGVVLWNKDGLIPLSYGVIAKAKLSDAEEGRKYE
jgi:ribosome maturation factor RimP